MSSPLGPKLANVFICHFENIWFENYLPLFKPMADRLPEDATFLPL